MMVPGAIGNSLFQRSATELAGEAYQRYLDREANAAKIAELGTEHLQNSHND